ncbi:dTDP-4-dehydrorhamnose reductase [Hoyosella sp. YIM 151337]|uniref:dTDP-4-dehydrorhamnose reductase n=1 Tax=Hoyosella sp. YIM 151337 TaxID=2992742 RepID=UPI002235D745|nr:dTDP-4-dehydrorhamnose reductase [Hoyosella sp. YIM 151337]MCW4352322.1 dTDP-4-dehydrorhamnose reductase [Hoyosella sp. YIM 151337]
MRVVVTGAGGQLGRQIVARGPAAGADIVGYTAAGLDVTDAAATNDTIAQAHGDVVINCAAYTAVDRAESEEERAAAINTVGAANVAAACAATGTHLIHVSTDYVFGGAAEQPYEPDAPTSPATAYGRTKLAGEHAVRAAAPTAQIVRTSWVFTGEPADFVGTMIRLAGERDFLDVVDDQVGSPTYSGDLAAGLLQLAAAPHARAITALHATNAGTATWFSLAQAVFSEIGADPARIRPCTTAAFPRPAPRPHFSVLSDRAWRGAGLSPLRHWRDALHAALADRRTGT